MRSGLVALLLLPLFGWLALPLVPLPAGLFQPPVPAVELLDAHGQTLREVAAGDELIGRRVALGEVPAALIHATLAAEDKRFWSHPGVDWCATARAAWGLVKHGRIVSGGSTITQQLVKLTEPRPRTFRTKFIEAAQALRLEQVWSKEQILAAYLNRIDYGNLRFGCAAAAQFYFGKPLRDLSVAECALLAGLPQAPTRHNPHRNLVSATKRQAWILGRMAAAGWLTDAERERAAAEPLSFGPPHRAFQAPHFVDLLLQLDPDALAAGGPVRTTLDLSLQRVAERALREQLAALREQRVRNGAVVVIENRTGNVLALVGSEDYFEPGSGQVNGAWAARSAGSTFKPFTYLLALERGATPATVVADVPTEFATATGVFAPVNYNHRCLGPTRLRLALANSLNIAAVKVLAGAGGPAALQTGLRDCGLTTLARPAEHYGLGLTIGNAEARLLELANAYACLARLGEARPFRLVQSPKSVGDADALGDVRGRSPSPQPSPAGRGGAACRSSESSERSALSEDRMAFSLSQRERAGVRENGVSESTTSIRNSKLETQNTKQVCDPEAAWLIADILSDNAARTPAFGAESPLRFDFPVACKTGTSSDFRDNWALGYTPEFTVGVWVGNFDGTPMERVSGVSGAAPVLHGVFTHLRERFGTNWYDTPAGVTERTIHSVTGKLVATAAHGAVLEKFLVQRLPETETRADYDAEGRVRLPSEYRDWLASGENSLAGRAVAEAQSEVALRISSPLPGTVFFLDPDLPERGRIAPLKALGGAELSWTSDTLECRREAERTVAVLREGRHELTVRDATSGRAMTTWVVVKAL